LQRCLIRTPAAKWFKMAKKSFKRGLGSLIQDSSIEFEANGISKDNSQTEVLQAKIEKLQLELKLWRTGKLNIELFNKALEENNLIYNPTNNSFESKL
jgi:hypothetical protein